MADAGKNERASLGIHSKKRMTYGSTAQSSQTNETFLKHYVKPGETMQGITLKYGVTVSIGSQSGTQSSVHQQKQVKKWDGLFSATGH